MGNRYLWQDTEIREQSLMTKWASKPSLDWRMIARVLLAVFYLLAGIAHLRSPGGFIAITPAWVPNPAMVVRLTGYAEIAGAIGVMIALPPQFPSVRRAAAIGLALYAVCVFPANINHAVNHIPLGATALGWSYHAPRLLLQPVIIWWALWAGQVINWPFRSKVL
jgi:uncharacterized membrane protein